LQVSELFCGKEFCVVSGATFKNKADIERIIIKCGGSVVQNPGNEFHFMNVMINWNTVIITNFNVKSYTTIYDRK